MRHLQGCRQPYFQGASFASTRHATPNYSSNEVIQGFHTIFAMGSGLCIALCKLRQQTDR